MINNRCSRLNTGGIHSLIIFAVSGICNILLQHNIWKTCSRRWSWIFITQVSESYKNTGNTKIGYRAILVVLIISALLHIFDNCSITVRFNLIRIRISGTVFPELCSTVQFRIEIYKLLHHFTISNLFRPLGLLSLFLFYCS